MRIPFFRWSTSLLGLLFLFGMCAAAQGEHAQPPVLTQVQQIRELFPEEAAQGFPVLISAALTHYDPVLVNLLVQDAASASGTDDSRADGEGVVRSVIIEKGRLNRCISTTSGGAAKVTDPEGAIKSDLTGNRASNRRSFLALRSARMSSKFPTGPAPGAEDP